MQYQKLKQGDTIIEFHNNWLGEETVIANGQIVSKQSSIWGTNHHFTIMEDGHPVKYVLTSKVNANMQVMLDLIRNGEPVQENVVVMWGSVPPRPENKYKKEGLKLLKEYDLEEAVEKFQRALELNVKDPETYFHLACAYSLLERTNDGFMALKNALTYGLKDVEMILNHDMLAFLRMQKEFETFIEDHINPALS